MKTRKLLTNFKNKKPLFRVSALLIACVLILGSFSVLAGNVDKGTSILRNNKGDLGASNTELGASEEADTSNPLLGMSLARGATTQVSTIEELQQVVASVTQDTIIQLSSDFPATIEDTILLSPVGDHAITLDGQGINMEITVPREHFKFATGGSSLFSIVNISLDGSNLGGGIVLSTNGVYAVDSLTTTQFKQGNGINSGRVLTIKNSTFTNGGGSIHSVDNLIVDGVSFENFIGTAISGKTKLTVSNSSFKNANGSAKGIHIASATTIIDNSVFENLASGNGAGVSVGDDADVLIKNSSFINNIASGGGYSGGAISANASQRFKLVVENSFFDGNTIAGSQPRGGAIGLHNIRSAKVEIYQSYFVNNKTITKNSGDADGGAVSIFGANNPNEAVDDNSLIIDSCYFEANTAEDDAGAVFIEGSGGRTTPRNMTAIVRNSTFYKNEGKHAPEGFSDSGGAIQISNRCTVTLENNTFYDNYHGQTGGAVGRHTGFLISPLITLKNNIFSGNSSGDGSNLTQQSVSVGSPGTIARTQNIGLDSGAAVPEDEGVQKVYGMLNPTPETNGTNYMAGNDDYRRPLPTLWISPAGPIKTKSSTAIDFGIDGRGKKRNASAPVMGAVEIGWVQLDSGGGTWEANPIHYDGHVYFDGANDDFYYVADLDENIVITDEISSGRLIPPDSKIFFEWNLSEGGGGTAFYPGETFPAHSGGTILYAVWDNALVTVTFDANGGTFQNPSDEHQLVKVGEKVTKPTVSNTGHHLEGWFTENGEKWDFNTPMANQDITLTAKWTVEKNEVVFRTNGGLPLVPPMFVEYGTLIPEPVTISKEHHVFVGWFTDDGIKWNFNVDLMPEYEFVLNAHWEETLSIEISPTIATIRVGEAVNFVSIIQPVESANQNVIWESSGPSAFIDQNGMALGISPGMVHIRATSVADPSVYVEATLTVLTSVSDIEIAPSDKDVLMKSNTSKNISAKIMPEDAEIKDTHWTSDNPSVATVIKTSSPEDNPQSAEITGITDGKSIVTVASNDPFVNPPVTNTINVSVDGTAPNFDTMTFETTGNLWTGGVASRLVTNREIKVTLKATDPLVNEVSAGVETLYYKVVSGTVTPNFDVENTTGWTSFTGNQTSFLLNSSSSLLPSGGDGTYRVYVVAVDKVGNHTIPQSVGHKDNEDDKEIIIDTEKPEISGGKDIPWLQDDLLTDNDMLNGISTNKPESIITYTVADGNGQTALTELVKTPGVYPITYQVTDALGNTVTNKEHSVYVYGRVGISVTGTPERLRQSSGSYKPDATKFTATYIHPVDGKTKTPVTITHNVNLNVLKEYVVTGTAKHPMFPTKNIETKTYKVQVNGPIEIKGTEKYSDEEYFYMGEEKDTTSGVKAGYTTYTGGYKDDLVVKSSAPSYKGTAPGKFPITYTATDDFGVQDKTKTIELRVNRGPIFTFGSNSYIVDFSGRARESDIANKIGYRENYTHYYDNPNKKISLDPIYDFSKINLNQEGTYPLMVIAKDKFGKERTYIVDIVLRDLGGPAIDEDAGAWYNYGGGIIYYFYDDGRYPENETLIIDGESYQFGDYGLLLSAPPPGV